MTDAEAIAAFKAYRFADNGGEAYCPNAECKCPVAYTHKSGVKFTCAKCKKQFTLTSGTPFAYRKLGFRELMYIIAVHLNNIQGVSASSLAKDLEVQYKTAFVWLHKFREELGEWLKGLTLEGEVEIDGAYFGGEGRGPNVKKTAEENATKRNRRIRKNTLCPVVARQRGGGPVIPWIVRTENHALNNILGRLKPNTILYADSAGGWGGQASSINFIE